MYRVTIADVAELTEEILKVEFGSELTSTETISSKIVATITISGQISFDSDKRFMLDSAKAIAAWSLLKPSCDDTYKKVSVVLSSTGETRYELPFAYVISYHEQFEDQNGFFKLVVKEINPDYCSASSVESAIVDISPLKEDSSIQDNEDAVDVPPQPPTIEGVYVFENETERRYREIENDRKKIIDKLNDNGKNLKGTEGCIALVVVNGKPFFGRSGSLVQESKVASRIIMKKINWHPKSQPKDLRGVLVLRHAEADSLFEAALEYGKDLPDDLVIYVEKPTCKWCKDGLPYVMRHLGVKKLTIYQKEAGDNDNPYVISGWPELPSEPELPELEASIELDDIKKITKR